MIKLLEKNEMPSVNFTDGFSVAKIKANLLAYGFEYPFLNFWYQTKANKVTALLCKMENAVIISADTTADLKEIKDFLNVTGYTSLQGSYELLSKMGLGALKEYTVVCKNTYGSAKLPVQPNLQKVYNILYSQRNEHIKSVPFESFYVDLSHRIRHGCAAAVVFDECATAVASHITEDAAVISGVSTLCEARGKGAASKALNELTDALGRRKVFAAAEKDVVPFYLKNGFTVYNKIAIYENEEK